MFPLGFRVQIPVLAFFEFNTRERRAATRAIRIRSHSLRATCDESKSESVLCSLQYWVARDERVGVREGGAGLLLEFHGGIGRDPAVGVIRISEFQTAALTHHHFVLVVHDDPSQITSESNIVTGSILTAERGVRTAY